MNSPALRHETRSVVEVAPSCLWGRTIAMRDDLYFSSVQGRER
jgi:hypothetical protein